jgi:hypothetical protein
MKPTTTTFLLAATLCASALVMPAARADYMDMSNSAGMMAQMWADRSQFISTQSLNNSIASQYGTNESTGGKTGHKVRKTKPKPRVMTTYRESPAVTKRTVTRFTNWVATKTNATAAESIRRDFENDALGYWAKEVAKDGLKRGDVADAMTQYWLMSWQIANRSMSDPTRAQV